jgi:two-component system, OmpR family, sensor histidine kinase KdpD
MVREPNEVFGPATWKPWVLWMGVLAIVTTIMVAVRDRLSDTLVALAYLLVVLLAGARGGRAIALTTASVAFLAFNWFFFPPYGTLALTDPTHWFVLVAFLVASVVTTQVFDKARREAVLQESLRARDAVMASLSHDLRAPLTSIKALAHEMAAQGDDRARLIEDEANRLHVMVADVLDLSRLNTGALRLSIDLNDAEDVIGAALKRISAVWPAREIRVHIAEHETILFGHFDFTNTLRILVNLLDNALKYSASYDPVDFEAVRDGPWIQFRILDRGDGVPVDERERIFEPFYRPDGMAPDVHGAGLGLSIARALSEAQGGSLTYAPRKGGGSVFTLAVPAADLPKPIPQ